MAGAGDAPGGDALPARRRSSLAEQSPPQANPFREFQVVVLAGGNSPRLSALTESHVSSPDDLDGPPSRCCKALLPVANRPMIWYCLKSLQESRFGDIIVVTQDKDQEDLVSYLREEFTDAFQRLEVVGLGREERKKNRQQQQQTRRGSGGSSSYYAGEEGISSITSSRSTGGRRRNRGKRKAKRGGNVGKREEGDAADEEEDEEQQQDLYGSEEEEDEEGGDSRGEGGDEEEGDGEKDGEDDEGEEEGEDEEDGACGTAEALLHIKHLLYTDFFVLPCDIIGQVDFYALANVHRVENAACSVYLLPFNCLEQQQQLGGGGGGGGKKNKGGNKAAQQQQQAAGSNAVAVAYANRQLLAWQDRRSIQHGAKLKIPKLSLFYHPCMQVRSNFYDPHVYLFKHSVLQLLGSKSVRDVITSIRFDLVPYMTLMQESPVASIWSSSRLGSHVYGMLLDSFEKEGQHHPAAAAADNNRSSSPTVAAAAGSSSSAALSSAAYRPKATQEYTVANRPPRPHNGHRVMFTVHPETAGLSCRVNTLEDYYAANMEFCGLRTDALRGLLPEFFLPVPPSKRPPSTRDSVIGEGVVFADSAVVKRSVIGADVRVAAAARVTTSVLMEAAAVGEGAVLQHCVLGKKATVGNNCKLTNCQVRHGYSVPPNTVAEDETLPSFINSSSATSFF